MMKYAMKGPHLFVMDHLTEYKSKYLLEVGTVLMKLLMTAEMLKEPMD